MILPLKRYHRILKIPVASGTNVILLECRWINKCLQSKYFENEFDNVLINAEINYLPAMSSIWIK